MLYDDFSMVRAIECLQAAMRFCQAQDIANFAHLVSLNLVLLIVLLMNG